MGMYGCFPGFFVTPVGPKRRASQIAPHSLENILVREVFASRAQMFGGCKYPAKTGIMHVA